MSRLVLMTCLLGLAVACSKGDRTDGVVVVRKVLVDVEPPAEAAGISDREAVRGIVNRTLVAFPGLRVDEEQSDGAVLRVRVESLVKGVVPGEAKAQVPGQPSAPGAPAQMLSLSVELTSGQATQARGRASATAPIDVEPTSLVAQALRDALGQVVQAREADGLESPVLLGWLPLDAQVSEEQRRQAIRLLGMRREKGAVEPLAQLLQSADRERAMLALGALASIGDGASVDALIAFSEGKPSGARKATIDAVRAIGSPRAAPWLFVLSSGHPDAEIQTAAEQALAALEGTKGEAARVAEQRPDKPPVTQTP